MYIVPSVVNDNGGQNNKQDTFDDIQDRRGDGTQRRGDFERHCIVEIKKATQQAKIEEDGGQPAERRPWSIPAPQ